MCFNPKYAWFNYIWDKEKHKLTKKLHFKYNKEDTEKNIITIPCGKCLSCRIDRANNFATRCILESRRYKEKCFVTLSYNNKNLPKNGTLVVRDIQLFMKRLRKRLYPREIRFFACGEYGDRTLRAHYHILIYNYYPKDAKFFKFNKNKEPLYISKEIADIWGKGFIILGEVTNESAGYVARYTQKKIYNKHDKLMEQLGRKKEFILSSRRPGIGLFMFGKNKHKETCITNKKEFEKIKNNFGILIKQNNTVKLKNIPQSMRQKWREIDEFEYYEAADKNLEKVKNNIREIIEKKGISEKQYTEEQRKSAYERLKKLKREAF